MLQRLDDFFLTETQRLSTVCLQKVQTAYFKLKASVCSVFMWNKIWISAPQWNEMQVTHRLHCRHTQMFTFMNICRIKEAFSFVVCLWSSSSWPYGFTTTRQALRRTNRASAEQKFLTPATPWDGLSFTTPHVPTSSLRSHPLLLRFSVKHVWESISCSKQVFPRQGLTVTLTPWMAVTPVCTHRLECEWTLMGGGHWEGTPQLN